jgi:uncharacterized protein
MFSRSLATPIIESMRDTPVLLLHGARQTGKSTLMRSLAKTHSSYVTLDDATTLSAVQQDPAGFLMANQGELLIDEVQRAPNLFLAIKHEVDSARLAGSKINGRFLLSGSANVLLLPKLADSLAGRMEIHTLWPLAQSEISIDETRCSANLIDALFCELNSNNFELDFAAVDRGLLINQMVAGGYPEALSRKSDKRRQAWFDAYLQTIIQRDIRDIANIEGLVHLPRLLNTLAHRATGVLNIADVSRTLGIAQTSLSRYLQLLQTVFLISELPAWTHRASHRAQKTPKVFFNDSGLMAHLLGLSTQQMIKTPGLHGPLLETFVFSELQKLRTWSVSSCELLHYRTSTGDEVDFILQDRQGRIVGIEVKANTQAHADDFKGMRRLRELIGSQFHRGIVLHPGSQSVRFDSQLASVPLSVLWASLRLPNKKTNSN